MEISLGEALNHILARSGVMKSELTRLVDFRTEVEETFLGSGDLSVEQIWQVAEALMKIVVGRDIIADIVPAVKDPKNPDAFYFPRDAEYRYFFGTTLKLLRVRAGLTQAELSRSSGHTKSCISMYESWQLSPPSPDVIKKFSRILTGESDILFRAARKLDPDLSEFIEATPTVARMVRLLKNRELESGHLEIVEKKFPDFLRKVSGSHEGSLEREEND
jgi:transcriptional regulator with XRE-family HTH domain